MRWKINKHEAYEKYVIRKFAWLPITIGNEARWLEFVNIEVYYWISNYSGKKYLEYVRFVD